MLLAGLHRIDRFNDRDTSRRINGWQARSPPLPHGRQTP